MDFVNNIIMEKNIVKAFVSLKEAFKVQAWVLESAFVLIVLLTTAIVSGKGWVEYLSVAAVFFTFKHASVSERLREANEANAKKAMAETTSCAHKLNQFFILKEILWVAFFALSGAWSALAGCGIFLLYAWWRKAYRTHHPRTTTISAPKQREFYRHFKYSDADGINGCYELMHLGEFTENGERMVIYRPLYKLPDMWEDAVSVLVRTEKNFNQFEERMAPHETRFRLIEDPETINKLNHQVKFLYNEE